MADTRTKDPDRVMTGRLGAHILHASGKTNTDPARRAFMARFEREVDPDGVLPPAVRAARAEHAKRAYFTRMSRQARHGRRPAGNAA